MPYPASFLARRVSASLPDRQVRVPGGAREAAWYALPVSIVRSAPSDTRKAFNAPAFHGATENTISESLRVHIKTEPDPAVSCVIAGPRSSEEED